MTKIREYEAPTFGYRLGDDGEIEKDIFDGELPDGWVDSPAYVGLREPVAFQADATEAPPFAGPVTPMISPPYGKYKFAELSDEHLRRTGKRPRVGLGTASVAAALDELDSSSAA